MAASTVRLSDEKHARLKALAKARGEKVLHEPAANYELKRSKKSDQQTE